MMYLKRNLKIHFVAVSFVVLLLIGMIGASHASEDSFYGMKIEQVQAKENRLSVTTTGAIYILEQNRMEMWRRIDPASNTIFPQLVAVLEFDTDVGTISLTSQTTEETKIHTNLIEFTFYTDSLVCIKANASFSYRHTNQIVNAPWNKGSGLNRMWTNGKGGSLHAIVQGAPGGTNQLNHTTIQMHPGNIMAHQVYPPRKFDYQRLFGLNARPHTKHLWNITTDPYMSAHAANGVGVYVLWNEFYTNKYKTNTGYQWVDPKAMENFIQAAHNKNFKLVAYINAPANWSIPPTEVAAWIGEFVRQYKLDGVYLDNANAQASKNSDGSLNPYYSQNKFWPTYDFIKQVRRELGDDAVIIHHNSVDPWGGHCGLKATMIDAYVNYTMRGETWLGELPSDPDDLFNHFWFGERNFSGAIPIWFHQVKGGGMSTNDAARLMARLNGAWRQVPSEYGLKEYLQQFNIQKLEYQLATLNPTKKTITATASQGGSITPAGEIQVPLGESVKYTITPDTGYRIVDVRVNSVSKGAVTSYTFNTVIKNHTIHAQFAVPNYTISATAGEGGTIEPSGQIVVEEGQDQTFSILATSDFYIEDVIVNNVSQGAKSDYTFPNVTQDQSITVVFGQVIVPNSSDTIEPKIVNCFPQPDAIQVPQNSLITLHVIDVESGVQPDSIVLYVQDEIIYKGDTAQYDSPLGCCRRMGARSDYCFTFQPNRFFDFDREIQVRMSAADQVGNMMTDNNAYSFRTEMRRFGGRQILPSESSVTQNAPRTVCDGLGTLGVVWESGPEDARNIYFSRLLSGDSAFHDSLRITNGLSDQCRPDIAVDNQNTIYVVWQDNRRGNWDIYLSTSTDGQNWSPEISLIETEQDKANQTNPRIAVASDNTVYVVFQDDRHGNQDIYRVSSSNGFAAKTISALTTDSTDQTQPDIAVDADDNVFVVWTDARNDSTDIYGADSLHNWMNVPVVKNAANQTEPALAADSEGSNLHIAWTDDSNGNKDIFYAATEHSLPQNPLTGINIVDDSTGAEQTAPTISTGSSNGGSGKVFMCWQDNRNIALWNLDRDIYFTEGRATFGVNILVTDDASYFGQGSPALAVNAAGQPYLIWSESNASGGTNIVYSGTTHIRTPALAEKEILSRSGGYVGANPESIAEINDVCVEIPPGAFRSDLKVAIMKIVNPSENSQASIQGVEEITRYEFGPSSPEEFTRPVTITIPYESDGSVDETIYWFNPKIDDLSQTGISNVQRIVISDSLCALRFTTTHFTQYVVAAAGTDTNSDDPADGGGSGGGCAMSQSPANLDGIEIFEFFLPFIILMGILIVWKRKESKQQRVANEP
jgi:List-Bact-rpt repeat protein